MMPKSLEEYFEEYGFVFFAILVAFIVAALYILARLYLEGAWH